jgi:hypothetical protein
MTLKNKTYDFKDMCSICKSELARHRSLVDIEYRGNFAATSSVCKLKHAQALHCSLTVYSFPTLQCAYISGSVSTEFHYASKVCK